MDELKRIEDLVLVRLLAGDGAPVTRAKLAKDLESIVEHRYVGTAWTSLLEEACTALEEQGDLEVAKGGKKVYPTDGGKKRALAFLGVERLPAKTAWSTLRKVYLFAKAMGVPAGSPAAVNKLASATGMCAVILRNAYDLPTEQAPTPAQALNALLWKQLGRESTEAFSMPAVKAFLLGKALGEPTKMTPAQLHKALAGKAVGARRVDSESLLRGALKRLLGPEDAPGKTRAAPGTPNLETFAQNVLAAGASSPTGWFGDPAIANKVFVSHVYKAYAQRHPEEADGIERFKERLIEANRAGLLKLSRADLVEAMNLDDVRASEILHMNASFHFVIVKERA